MEDSRIILHAIDMPTLNKMFISNLVILLAFLGITFMDLPDTLTHIIS